MNSVAPDALLDQVSIGTVSTLASFGIGTGSIAVGACLLENRFMPFVVAAKSKHHQTTLTFC